MVKISVIIPVYNAQDYLNECIDSVLNQSFTDFEVICVDDESTDNSLEILKAYNFDKRVKIISKEHSGLGATRNVALDIAQGDYILFIDSDDYLDLNTLEITYDLAIKNSLDCILFKIINFNNKTGKKFSSEYFDMKFLSELVGKQIFNWTNIKNHIFDISVTAPSKLFKRELIQDIRFPEGLIFEDNLFFIKTIFNAKRVYFYDEYLYYRRIRSDSITNSFYKDFSDCITIYGLIYDYMKEIGLYNEFGEQIFNKECYDIFHRFSQTKEEFKQDFYDEIKLNFSKRKNELEKDQILKICSERSLAIFNSAIETNTYKEFELEVNLFDLKRNNDKLKLDNNIQRRKNETEMSKLKKSNENYKNEIDDLKNSLSFKISKIFSLILNYLKKKLKS